MVITADGFNYESDAINGSGPRTGEDRPGLRQWRGPAVAPVAPPPSYVFPTLKYNEPSASVPLQLSTVQLVRPSTWPHTLIGTYSPYTFSSHYASPAVLRISWRHVTSRFRHETKIYFVIYIYIFFFIAYINTCVQNVRTLRSVLTSTNNGGKRSCSYNATCVIPDFFQNLYLSFNVF